MTNLKFKQTLTAGVALATALYPQAFACEEGYIKGVNTGNCIKASDSCGTNCTYTLDEEGNLTINGTGAVPTRGTFYKNKDIKNVKISEGIQSIGEHAFCESSIESVSIPSTVTRISGDAFSFTNLKELIIPDTVESHSSYSICENCNNLEYLYLPENNSGDWRNGVTGTTKLNFVLPETVRPWKTNTQVISASLGNIYCTGAQIESGFCASDVNRYEKDGDNYIIYNTDGSVREVVNNFHDFSEKAYKGFENRTISVDENGNIVATYPDGSTKKYDAHGNFTEIMLKTEDGSAYWYDANGKLIGAKKTTAFTPAEAAALIKKGNVNKVTLTFK